MKLIMTAAHTGSAASCHCINLINENNTRSIFLRILKQISDTGRFDRKVAVGRPDVKGREEILKVHANGKPLGEDVDLTQTAQTDIPNLVTIAFALAVASLISWDAPVVMSSKICSSATRPPNATVISCRVAFAERKDHKGRIRGIV